MLFLEEPAWLAILSSSKVLKQKHRQLNAENSGILQLFVNSKKWTKEKRKALNLRLVAAKTLLPIPTSEKFNQKLESSEFSSSIMNEKNKLLLILNSKRWMDSKRKKPTWRTKFSGKMEQQRSDKWIFPGEWTDRSTGDKVEKKERERDETLRDEKMWNFSPMGGLTNKIRARKRF